MPRTTPAGAFRRAFAAAALAAASPAEALETPFEATRRGANCNLVPDGSLRCFYTVGEDLRFELRRIGEPDVALRILRSLARGHYIADAELLSGCVFVRHGPEGVAAGGLRFDYAFVSGRNGLVYDTLEDCRAGR